MQNFTEFLPTVVDAAQHSEGLSNIISASIFGAAIAGLAGAAPGVAQGLAAGKAVEAISRQPAAVSDIRSTLIIGCVLAETAGIYGLLIALLLIFANPFVAMYTSALGL